MNQVRPLYLGASRPLDGGRGAAPVSALLPPHHLVTHGVVLGMTGSGKTGLLMVMVEEALRSGVPVIMMDVKGDLPNLLLNFPTWSPSAIEPWVESHPQSGVGAAELAEERRKGHELWKISETDLGAFAGSTRLRVLTPGSNAGEPLQVLSSLERRSSRWDTDPDAARATLSAAVSLLLRLLGRDPDPARSREHVLLSVLAERRLVAKEPSDIASLMADLAKPPVERIGALSVNEFMSGKARKDLAAALNNLLASPTFASWREGAALDPRAWLEPTEGKTPGVIVSVAHLDDDERTLVLGVLLEEILTWVRSLPGSTHLRALVVFDEVYGFLPPHPANPPTKRPIIALMKQARAFGVGVIVATQNPMDLDYRALSNAGFWCIGRLQTDADRARVLDGLAQSSAAGESAGELAELTKRLKPRWFLTRDVHSSKGTTLLQPRWTMSFMKGPMTGAELRRARRGSINER
jgi:hypothetical protein